MRNLLFAAILFLCSYLTSWASHITGSEITYEHINNNTYNVHLYIYWDCTGGFNPGASQTLGVSGCMGSQTITLNQSTNTPNNGIDVTKTCPGVYSNCSGGMVGGINMIEYTGLLTLPGACDNWILYWSTCCRGGDIINIMGGTTADTYISATLNNILAPNNNSPYFTQYQPIYACVNQTVTYNMNALDNEGNTLLYSIVPALEGQTSPATYNAPYSGELPVQNISIDSLSGQLSFIPAVQGAFVIAVMVTEINSNGDTLAVITRDFQTIVTNCTNQNIISGNGALSIGDISGQATLQDPLFILTCEGSSFSFSTEFEDPDLGDSLTITTNISTNPYLSGTANFSQNFPIVGQYNNSTFSFSWTVPYGIQSQNVYLIVTIRDNNCPFPAERIVIYTIHVVNSTYAGGDKIICAGDSITLNSSGAGTTFTWYDIAGNIIPVDANFSCNPCQNPTIKPATTTTYILQSTGGGSCINTDTVTIHVVPGFSWTLNPGSVVQACTGNSIQLGIQPVETDVYSYSWQPTGYLNQSTISQPQAIFPTPGTYHYTVTITNTAGCAKTDSLSIITQQGVPDFSLRADTCMLSVPSQAIQLNVEYSCLITETPCTVGENPSCLTTNIQVGNQSLISFANPTPFMGNWEDGKCQMLFRASELQALNINQGALNSLALNIPTVSSNGGYSDLTIKMSCTSEDSVTVGSFITNTTEVYHSTLFNPIPGWNTFNFDSSYFYDGISNLVIEICFDNNDWSGDDNVECSPTSFISTATYDTDGSNGCSQVNSEQVYSSRPNVRFDFASSINSANYTYSWIPSTGVSDTSIANPTVTPPLGNTTYYVTVTTQNGICSRTDSVTFHVDPNNPQILNHPIGDSICVGQSTNLSTDVIGSGISYQWFKETLSLSNGTHFSGVNTNTLTIGNASLAETGSYRCEIIGGCSPDHFTNSAFVSVENCISLNDQNQGSDFIIYPNPAHESLTIRLAGRNNGVQEIKVTDLLGKVLIKKEITNRNEKEISIETGNLVSGCYILMVKNEGATSAKTFIKE